MKKTEKNAVDKSIWLKILKASLKIADWKVDRKAFLTEVFEKYCEESQMNDLLKYSPITADLDDYFIKKVADQTINNQVMKLSGLSFVAGLPGGLAMAGTVPADIAQFYYHIIVLSQKLAYIYGWPQIFDQTQQETTEEDLTKLTFIIGVMFGNLEAEQAMEDWANEIKQLPEEAGVTFRVSRNDGMLHLAAQIAKWLAIKITKESFGKSASKIVPILGGLFSGGMSYISAKGMTANYIEFMQEQHFAKEKLKKTTKKKQTPKKPKEDKD